MSILIDADTTFIVQGITGREAVNLTRECLDYGAGAKIVGGVTPGRLGRDVHGVPVFDTVAQAVEHHGGPIDGSVVTVPPAFTKDAVFEAIENGIKLIVIVTERIPRRDVAQMVELADEHGARIIGPNCLGIIVPDVIKMGGIGGPAKDAAQGLLARPGRRDLALGRHDDRDVLDADAPPGLGQSTAVSIGGDAIIGSTYAELMPLFEADEQTEAIVIYTEPGGRMEAQLARVGRRRTTRGCRSSRSWPAASWTRCRACASATPARSSRARRTPRREKIARLAEAGIVVAERIADIPGLVESRIGERSAV